MKLVINIKVEGIIRSVNSGIGLHVGDWEGRGCVCVGGNENNALQWDGTLFHTIAGVGSQESGADVPLSCQERNLRSEEHTSELQSR